MPFPFKKLNFFCIATVMLFINSSSFAQQLEFKDFTLGILQSIAYTTTYNDFVEFEREKKIEITRTKNSDSTESVRFSLSGKEIKILYSKDQKLIYATTTIERYDENNKTFEQLEEKNFEVTDNIVTKADAFGPMTRYFNKAGYPYEFAIYYVGHTNTNEVYIFNKEFGTFANFRK